jgi:hypothetical protein
MAGQGNVWFVLVWALWEWVMSFTMRDNRPYKRELLRVLSSFGEHGDADRACEEMQEPLSHFMLKDQDAVMRRAHQLLSAGRAGRLKAILVELDDFSPQRWVLWAFGVFFVLGAVSFGVICFAFVIDVVTDSEVSYRLPVMGLTAGSLGVVLHIFLVVMGESAMERQEQKEQLDRRWNLPDSDDGEE